jgi:hypothetical protein
MPDRNRMADGVDSSIQGGFLAHPDHQRRYLMDTYQIALLKEQRVVIEQIRELSHRLDQINEALLPEKKKYKQNRRVEDEWIKDLKKELDQMRKKENQGMIQPSVDHLGHHCIPHSF